MKYLSLQRVDGVQKKVRLIGRKKFFETEKYTEKFFENFGKAQEKFRILKSRKNTGLYYFFEKERGFYYDRKSIKFII